MEATDVKHNGIEGEETKRTAVIFCNGCLKPLDTIQDHDRLLSLRQGNGRFECERCTRVQTRLRKKEGRIRGQQDKNSPANSAEKLLDLGRDGELQLKCGYCPVVFRRKYNLARHITSVHIPLGQKAQFKSQTTDWVLARTLWQQNPEQSKENTPSNTVYISTAACSQFITRQGIRFKCMPCGKDFARKDGAVYHIRCFHSELARESASRKNSDSVPVDTLLQQEDTEPQNKVEETQNLGNAGNLSNDNIPVGNEQIGEIPDEVPPFNSEGQSPMINQEEVEKFIVEGEEGSSPSPPTLSQEEAVTVHAILCNGCLMSLHTIHDIKELLPLRQGNGRFECELCTEEESRLPEKRRRIPGQEESAEKLLDLGRDGELQLKCGYCPMVLRRKYNLARHITSVHIPLGQKAQFKKQTPDWVLARTLWQQNPEQSIENTPSNTVYISTEACSQLIKKSGIRFKCIPCGKSFARKDGAVYHIRCFHSELAREAASRKNSESVPVDTLLQQEDIEPQNKVEETQNLGNTGNLSSDNIPVGNEHIPLIEIPDEVPLCNFEAQSPMINQEEAESNLPLPDTLLQQENNEPHDKVEETQNLGNAGNLSNDSISVGNVSSPQLGEISYEVSPCNSGSESPLSEDEYEADPYDDEHPVWRSASESESESESESKMMEDMDDDVDEGTDMGSETTETSYMTKEYPFDPAVIRRDFYLSLKLSDDEIGHTTPVTGNTNSNEEFIPQGIPPTNGSTSELAMEESDEDRADGTRPQGHPLISKATPKMNLGSFYAKYVDKNDLPTFEAVEQSRIFKEYRAQSQKVEWKPDYNPCPSLYNFTQGPS